jgi:hypothetical protein
LNTSWVPGDYWGVSAEGRLRVMTDGPVRWFVFGGFGGYRCSVLSGYPSDSFMLSLNGGIGAECLLGPDGRRSLGLAVGVQGGSAKYRVPERVFNPGAGEEYLTQRERDYAMPVVLLRVVYCWYASAFSVTPRVERRDFVWGTVTDGVAQPLPGSTVTVAGSTAVVNSRGLYRISGIEPGLYRLTVAAEGFEAYESTVAVRGEREARHDVRLQRSGELSAAESPLGIGGAAVVETESVVQSTPVAAGSETRVSTPPAPAQPVRRATPASVPSRPAPPIAPEYQGPPGSVIAVLSRETVYLDLGADRGLAVGMQLAVLLPGVEPGGGALVGFVEVTVVHDTWSEARVIAETARPLEAGDAVRGLR